MSWIGKLLRGKTKKTNEQPQIPNVITLLFLPDGTLLRIVSSQVTGQLDLLATKAALINALGQIDMALQQATSYQAKKSPQDKDAP